MLHAPTAKVLPFLVVDIGKNFVKSTLLKLDRSCISALAVRVQRLLLLLETYQSPIHVSMKLGASFVILRFLLVLL